MNTRTPQQVDVIEICGTCEVRRSRRRLNPAYAMIEVEAVGICGTDRHIYEGTLPVPVGTVLGHEIIGRIANLPDPSAVIADWDPSPGDRVVLAPVISCRRCLSCLRHGMYCERRRQYGFGTSGRGPHGGMSRVVQLWRGSRIFRVPEQLSIERAVFIEPLAWAVRAVETALPSTGSLLQRTVTVVGFGPMGLAVALVARRHGAHVDVLEVDPERRRMARSLGFPADAPPAPESVRPAPAGRADVAVECAGSPDAFLTAVQSVRTGGTVVEAGGVADTGSCPLSPSEIFRRGLRVLGVCETQEVDYHAAVQIAAETPVDLALAVTHRWQWEDDFDPNGPFTRSGEFKQMIVMGEAPYRRPHPGRAPYGRECD